MGTVFLSEMNKLKNVQTMLEKNNSLKDNSLLCDDDYEHYNNYFINLEQERDIEIGKMKTELQAMWSLLKNKQKVLYDQSRSCLDLQAFKADMIALQDQMHSLKLKILANIELLKDQEKNLSEIINTYNQKIRIWEKPVKSIFTITHQNYDFSVYNSEYEAVKTFMDFVKKSKGHENGWSKEDHSLFLKLRYKHKNIENLARDLNQALPDISINSIQEHEKWFQKYLKLKDEKLQAIEKWRQNKKENIIPQESVHQTTNKRNNECYIISNKTDVREKIAEWKIAKAEKRARQEMNEMLRKHMMIKNEVEKKAMHSKIRDLVTQWKEVKLRQQQEEQIKKELLEYQTNKIKALEANKMIKQFQCRDHLFIMRMRSSKQTKSNKSSDQSSYVAERDPARIFQPTQQWLQRTSKNNFMNNGANNFISNVQNIPKLGVPEWRRNT